MREFESPAQLSVHHLIAELYDGVDWVLVEGFKYGDVPKIEIWRQLPDAASSASANTRTRTPLYPVDGNVIAVATDDVSALPVPPSQPVLDLNQPASVLQWLLEQGERLQYQAPQH